MKSPPRKCTQILHQRGGHACHRRHSQLGDQRAAGEVLVGQRERRSEQCTVDCQPGARPGRLSVWHSVWPAGGWLLVSADGHISDGAGATGTAAGPVPAGHARLHNVRPVCRLSARIYGVRVRLCVVVHALIEVLYNSIVVRFVYCALFGDGTPLFGPRVRH